MEHVGTFNSPRWGVVNVMRGHYGNADGPIAIALATAEGEPLATLSVNMYRPDCSRDSRELPAGCFYVKQWGENDEIANDAIQSGLFRERDDLPEAHSGYVSAPVWQLAATAA